jgi:hypothetical protein
MFRLLKGIIKLNIQKYIQGDQKVSVHLMITIQKVYSNNPHTIDDLKITITEYIRNVDRAIMNTVF